MTATKEHFFKPDKVSAQDKAAATDSVAKQIIAKENEMRESKTVRLRNLRVAQETQKPATDSPTLRLKRRDTFKKKS